MKKFESVIFWCEFPDQVDWKAFQKLVRFPTEVYVACKSPEEFLYWKKRVQTKQMKCGAWPVLPKKDGYWFSGYCTKESIDLLLLFQGLPVKVDVEPPIPRVSYSLINLVKYGIKKVMRKGKNNAYLHKVVEELAGKSPVIVSGLPLPWNIRRQYGDDIDVRPWKNARRNFFIYTTLHPKILAPFFRFYYRMFVRRENKMYGSKVLFALGCIGRGIFGDEPVYRNVKQFEKDVRFLLDSGAKNLVVFDVAGIMHRTDPGEWVNALKKRL